MLSSSYISEVVSKLSTGLILSCRMASGRKSLVSLDTVLSLREFVSRLSFYCVHKIADLL